MNVSVRHKKLAKGRKRIYLDFYPAIIHPETGKPTRREFLKLFLYERPKNETEKQHNRDNKAVAENIRAKRQMEILRGDYNFLCKDNKNANFLTYLKAVLEKRKEAKKNYASWRSMYMYLFRFTNGYLVMKNLTKQFSIEFKEYLLNTTTLNSNKTLKRNSAVSYFNIFKEALAKAHEENVLPENPALRVSSIKPQESEREFLTFEELQAMASTECEDPLLKRAAIFSALTGLRWGDVEKLVWSEIFHSKENGHYLRIRQEKTDRLQTLPVSDQAMDLLGTVGKPDDKVIQGLKYGNYTSVYLNRWAMKAGVTKHLTFHCFRHTYATLQLTMGTDIYTVSKLLGHKKLETTQIYAKVIDQKKQDAVNRIPKLDL